MKAYFKRFLNYFVKLESKIAFYPAVFSFLGFLFAFFMYYAENKGISAYLIENVPWMVINNADTARVILTTFIAGLISIMVFSFSMVMILLNQASSNYSPRVLPGLISNRRHQYILGIYNACLLYCIFTLITVKPTGDKFQLPGFSVLLSIIFMTICLGAFIYFIHSISQEIQINTILSKIYIKAKNRLNLLLKSEEDPKDFPNSDDWRTIHSPKTGYFQDINLHYLCEICTENDLKVETIAIKGEYLLEGDLILKVDSSVDEDMETKLKESFMFSKSEMIEDNYVLAFKQITEVAVKAMSPGINDPGTAVNAIDYLKDLLRLRLLKHDISTFMDDEGHVRIFIKTLNFKHLLYGVMASLRAYCKHDVLVVQKLFSLLSYLENDAEKAEPHYQDAIKAEIENLYNDCKASLTNATDLSLIEKLYLKS
ncbi:DUF2254 domain-containing protein [Winogradskyella maritima]|uniref:DUF2254 domain-containing protein n=1 Tax=Winogradskyella maritima TaxID=1517766 RepID=A0ABV8AGF7_9FLAO|nr:DUF2254 domain-containing protein [Winogradskyella maritima]